jgi:hypothetical protein
VSSFNHFQSEWPDGPKTVMKIERNRLNAPVEAMSDSWDINPGIIQGNCCSDPVGVTHDKVNMQTHIVTGVRIGEMTGEVHHISHDVTIEHSKLTGGSRKGAIGANGEVV